VADLHDWWVTVRLDTCRTCDYRITARSEYAAGWLWRKLHPEMDVIRVRPVPLHHAGDGKI